MKTSVRFGKEDIPRIFAICVSALIYSIGMVVFVRSGNLFPGGYAGVSRLLSLVAQAVSDSIFRSVSFTLA